MAPGAEDITEGLQEAGWTAACLHKVFNVASSNIDFFLHHRLFWWSLIKATRSGRDSCSYKHKFLWQMIILRCGGFLNQRSHGWRVFTIGCRGYCGYTARWCSVVIYDEYDHHETRPQSLITALTKRCNMCDVQYYLTWCIYCKR